MLSADLMELHIALPQQTPIPALRHMNAIRGNSNKHYTLHSRLMGRLAGHIMEYLSLISCTICMQEPGAAKQYPGCPAAGGLLKAGGQGQDQGRQQGAEPPRSFVFNELSLEEIKHVESTLVSIHPAIDYWLPSRCSW
jgi:hypothetical protein